MHSWVFRNRRRLEQIYARRRATPERPARAELAACEGPGWAEAEREGLRIHVLFPSRSPILPAA